MSILIFRTDTTGLFLPGQPLNHPGQPRIVHIEAALYTNSWKLRGSITSVIKSDGWLVREGAAKVHEISARENDLFRIRIGAALGVLLDFIRCTTEVATFNVPFHRNAIVAELQRIPNGDRAIEDLKRRSLQWTDLQALAAQRWRNGGTISMEDAMKEANVEDWDGDKIDACIALRKALK